MRALLLVMIVFATLPMAFVRPLVGLQLWIGFSYMNPHRIAYGFATGFPWVMLVACVTLFSLLINPQQRQAIPWKPVTVLLFAFLVWTAITSFTAIKGDAAWVEWEIFLKILVMAFATLVLVTNQQRLHWVLWGIVLSFGFWGFKGGLFTILSGGGYHVLGPESSFFRDNNQFALVMCMTLPLMRYLQLNTVNKWLRRGLWVLMLLTFVSIVGTYSRGGFLGLGAVSLMLALKSRSRVSLIAIGLVVAVAALAFMPQKWMDRMGTIDSYEQQGSAVTRFESWRFATNVALARPLTGGGFDVWDSRPTWQQHGPPGATPRAIHSIYFQVLGEQGFLGLVFYLALIATGWSGLRRIRKLARASPDTYWMGDLAAMLQVSLIGYLVAGAFLPMPYFDLFYQILVLVVVLQVFAERASQQAPQTQEDESKLMQAPPPSFAPAYRNRPEQPRVLGVKDLPRW